MNWKDEYKRKVSKPLEAIKDIHDGRGFPGPRGIPDKAAVLLQSGSGK